MRRAKHSVERHDWRLLGGNIVKLSEAMLKGWEIVQAADGYQCRGTNIEVDGNGVCALGAALVGTLGILPREIATEMGEDHGVKEYLDIDLYATERLTGFFPILALDGRKEANYGALSEEIASLNDEEKRSIPEIAAILDRRGL